MKVSSPRNFQPEVSETSGTALVADGHVHIYPGFDLLSVLETAWTNLLCISAAPSGDLPTSAIFLTERHDCDFYPKLAGAGPDTEVSVTSGGMVFAGRQMATAERLEVLALCTRQKFSDGLSIGESLQRVRDAGAIPVIPWSPGKWMFGRYAILRDLIMNAQPGDFLLADSSLRPLLYPEPSLFELARERGLGIIAGTDPLPFSGQEKILGSFGFRLSSGFDHEHPVESIRKALLRRSPEVDIIGRRASPLAVINRLYRYKNAQR